MFGFVMELNAASDAPFNGANVALRKIKMLTAAQVLLIDLIYDFVKVVTSRFQLLEAFAEQLWQSSGCVWDAADVENHFPSHYIVKNVTRRANVASVASFPREMLLKDFPSVIDDPNENSDCLHEQHIRAANPSFCCSS